MLLELSHVRKPFTLYPEADSLNQKIRALQWQFVKARVLMLMELYWHWHGTVWGSPNNKKSVFWKCFLLP